MVNNCQNDGDLLNSWSQHVLAEMQHSNCNFGERVIRADHDYGALDDVSCRQQDMFFNDLNVYDEQSSIASSPMSTLSGSAVHSNNEAVIDGTIGFITQPGHQQQYLQWQGSAEVAYKQNVCGD
ncbi:unnamed protein product [Soboliphyme baturini]|uniref:SCP domain-containing protein n=1 Tax=Soboliphyme baturini TaxID=241478 RepID=A0A183IF43_9BILA|nr:unnamed protein product [Soboliphyme baturini]